MLALRKVISKWRKHAAQHAAEYSQETGKQDILQHHIKTTEVKKAKQFHDKKTHGNEQVLHQEPQTWIPFDPSCL